ncbi:MULTISPECIES: DUF1127 domain-containing protein [Pseudomonas]|uniref:YjiS-like domain-containing protein n=1 Tax=Pseudomonas frederiksbergensis TaxID=104087 RepID=A0A2S8HMN6_9PSED|nr:MULTISPECIES: DUF1127 domain-containing protein [Pseudomonas]PQP03749.1 hypothetical protein C5612_14610 [Pseudomonas frederiksbergensis]WLG51036.1 DUF1127 domain-containing protein [Pseudomonas sp. FP1742]
MKNLLNISVITPRPDKLRRLLKALTDSLERVRTLRLLAQLNDQQLSDLGISRCDRLNELDKPFWRQLSA